MCKDEDVVRYILRKYPLSTFRLSRTLLLFDLEWNRRKGGKKTSFNYVLYPSAFYIENFPDFLERIEDVEKVVVDDDEGNKKGFFRLSDTREIKLPEEIAGILDEIMERTGDMDDHSLNNLVISREDYKKIMNY